MSSSTFTLDYPFAVFSNNKKGICGNSFFFKKCEGLL